METDLQRYIHPKTRNIIGKKFNLLTAINFEGYIWRRKNNVARWKFRCDCGVEKTLDASSVIRGRTKSCGCLQIINLKKRHTGNFAINKSYQCYRYWAKKRGYSFNLKIEEFTKIILQPCHYCGDKSSKILQNKGKDVLVEANGVDRLNSKIGYEVSNCVPCCGMCNKMKSIFIESEFLNQCLKIISYRRKNVRSSAISS